MDIMKLMKQAGQLKKAQKKINKQLIVDESNGAKVVLTGGGDLKKFEISDKLYEQGKDAVEDAVNKAVTGALNKQKKIQKSMAKETLGGKGMPDM